MTTTSNIALVSAAAFVALAVYLTSRSRAANGASEVKKTASAASSAAPSCDVLTAPARRAELPRLEALSLNGCGLTSVPKTIGLCVSLVRLDLGGNDLTTLPEEFAALERLETLFILGSRRMRAIPRVLGRMPSITRLGLRSNGIERVEGRSLPPNVVHLILTDNAIAHIDDEAYTQKLGKVRKLMLANNRLTTFGGPRPLKTLRHLELVRLANNAIQDLPADVLALPKLAWVALAGNPCARARSTARQQGSASGVVVRPYVLADLGDVAVDAATALGKGASGVVRAGTWRGRPVAVKMLAEKSSDGRAADELAVYTALGVGGPASLIKCFAVAPATADRPAAVVMERLPPTARDLALPPTIIEVSRDRYPDAERISLRFALGVLRDIAAALRHLHSNRVAHGDVYGHNILVDDASHLVKLGDFGAAFDYSALPGPAGDRVERVEVRAFGVLTAELATRLSNGFDRQARLLNLADECLHPDVANRPSFDVIATKLATDFS